MARLSPSDRIERRRMFTAAVVPALGVLMLWTVFGVEYALDLDLGRFGILPRTISGLRGILFAPLLHGDIDHLIGNSVPILVLGWCLVYFYPRVAGKVVLVTWLMGGLWVWIGARPNFHIGASGVIYGLAAFLFFSGVIRRQRSLMAISLVVVFLYGSMVWGVLPLIPKVSWESHLWGAAVGVVMAFLYRHVAPAHVQDPKVVEDDVADDAPDAPWRMNNSQAHPVRIVYHVGDKAGTQVVMQDGNAVSTSRDRPTTAGSEGAAP